MKILAIGNTLVDAGKDNSMDYVSIVQLKVFSRYKRLLKKRCNADCKLEWGESLDEIFSKCNNNKSDIYFIRPPWPSNPDCLKEHLKSLKSNHSKAKIVLIDPFDQTSSRFFECLPHVNLMLKYQCLKDRTEYLNEYQGGHSYSDYFARKWDLDTINHSVKSCADATQLGKICAGWSLAETDHFKNNLLKQKYLGFLSPKKHIDIISRLRIGKGHELCYYGKHRLLANEALDELRDKFNIAANVEITGYSREIISNKQYSYEFKRSKIAVCTFGWGEQSWREFEAIFNNALVIKPNMSHIDTYPNIYIPFETYVPVEWNYSDLAEKCTYYLNNQGEAQQIITRARELIWDHFKNDMFLHKFDEILSKLDF